MHANFREWGGGNNSAKNRRKPLPLRRPPHYRESEKLPISIPKYFAPFAGNLPPNIRVYSRTFAGYSF